MLDLADEIGKEDLLRLPGAQGSGGSNGEAWLFDSPLYEQLLVAASRSPAKLRAVDEVVGKLRSEASEVVPEEFLSFWEAFRPLLPTPRPTKDE